MLSASRSEFACRKHFARHREADQKLRRVVPKSKHWILLDFNKWRQLFLLSFGYDPLQCPKCNHTMEFLELCHKHKPVSLKELYERAMAKYIKNPPEGMTATGGLF